MRRRRSGAGDWLAERLELFRALGRSFGELVGAELAALSGDFKRSGKGLAVALGLLAGALFVTFWTVAAFIAALVIVFDLWLPLWGAALVVTGLMVALAGVLGGIGWWRLRSLEAPARTVARRWEDHRQWWAQRVLGEGAIEARATPAVDSTAADSEGGEDVEPTG